MNKKPFIVLILGFLVLIAGAMFRADSIASAGNKKMDACIAMANNYRLDPNDIEKSIFIKNCYNQ